MESRSQFDSKTCEIMSFDAKSLYTYTNINLTVDYLISEIYKNPDLYFDEGTKVVNGKVEKIPKVSLLRHSDIFGRK